jgi:hypothetical protein
VVVVVVVVVVIQVCVLCDISLSFPPAITALYFFLAHPSLALSSRTFLLVCVPTHVYIYLYALFYVQMIT